MCYRPKSSEDHFFRLRRLTPPTPTPLINPAIRFRLPLFPACRDEGGFGRPAQSGKCSFGGPR